MSLAEVFRENNAAERFDGEQSFDNYEANIVCNKSKCEYHVNLMKGAPRTSNGGMLFWLHFLELNMFYLFINFLPIQSIVEVLYFSKISIFKLVFFPPFFLFCFVLKCGS